MNSTVLRRPAGPRVPVD